MTVIPGDDCCIELRAVPALLTRIRDVIAVAVAPTCLPGTHCNRNMAFFVGLFISVAVINHTVVCSSPPAV